MDSQGFDFNFLTHQYINQKGNYYYFCYDFGYSYDDQDKVNLVTWQRYITLNLRRLHIEPHRGQVGEGFWPHSLLSFFR